MPSHDTEASRGFAFAMGAYLIWGLVMPVYMKEMDRISPVEIVAHRVIWAIPLALLVLWWQGQLRGIWRCFASLRTVALAALTAVLISLNWGTYVYAIVSDQALDAALGYYINPLVNVLLGAIFLSERPNRAQSVAIALAMIAVVILTVKAGGLPWISLVVAFSFGTYGLLRKMLPIGASEGFFLEVVILAPLALAAILWEMAYGESHFLANGAETALLVGAGPLTAVPLILFAAGARLLHYSTVGILQYTVPTMLALTAIFVFDEPFGGWQLVAFSFIWAALLIYTWTLFQKGRARRKLQPEVEASRPPSAQRI